MTQAESIRQHVQQRYIDPARRSGQTLVTVVAGDVHKELGLRNRFPSVCQAMESRLLERQAHVKVSSKQSPHSGRGTTFTIAYAVESSPAQLSVAPVSESAKKPLSDDERALRDGLFQTFLSRGDRRCTSIVTIGEVSVVPIRQDDFLSTARIDRFFSANLVTVLPISREVVEHFARIRAVTNVAPAGARRLACAGVHGCDLFITNDKGLLRHQVPGIRSISGLDVHFS
jgi:hypothetical protein